ncbi:hypothetical protein SAMN05720487_1105 [Fibrobacter sp. UWT2]|uniref:hypothetical protein n=1 Tax=Fibrobacter sp. UWT2 TaxID=1896224 RepID=UPI0009106D41|nr:hypothetical protein [Fibrobacter sp. UWT2]SHL23277.1 hypothetical protein SAMN05720487_1105 [Fibrobacter sp. UWT2]
MKKTTLITTIMMAAALSYAAPSSARPESSVPTPAENMEISREMPNLGAKESADWQKLRAERRAAREQILTDLRNSSAAEKKNIRQEVSKKRDEKPRFEGEIPKNQSRERTPFYEQPGSHQMNPMRDMPNGPAPAPMNPMNPMKPMDRPHR